MDKVRPSSVLAAWPIVGPTIGMAQSHTTTLRVPSRHERASTRRSYDEPQTGRRSPRAATGHPAATASGCSTFGGHRSRSGASIAAPSAACVWTVTPLEGVVQYAAVLAFLEEWSKAALGDAPPQLGLLDQRTSITGVSACAREGLRSVPRRPGPSRLSPSACCFERLFRNVYFILALSSRRSMKRIEAR